MTCRRATELMTEYLEGVLTGPDRLRFEAHLADCDGCTAYLAQMRATVATVGVLDADDVPAAVLEELVGLYRRYRSS
jgi:anti-sigma factor RsiW